MICGFLPWRSGSSQGAAVADPHDQALTESVAPAIHPAPGAVRAFGVAVMTESTRSSDGLDARRRRLLFRSWHRGNREMDFIMGRFADAHVADLSESEVIEFERLILVPDADLYAWIAGQAEIPQDYNSALFRRLCAFHSLARDPT